MPHSSFKLIPGVDQNRTPTLNEAALSTTNLVRFVPDRNGLGLVQKLGGWATLSYTTPITNVTVTYMPNIVFGGRQPIKHVFLSSVFECDDGGRDNKHHAPHDHDKSRR